MKRKLLKIAVAVIILAAISSGWIYNVVVNKNSISKDELNNLQISFMKQYGTGVTITQAITPKIFEFAWTDDKGNKNVSVNIGGIWVIIYSQPAATTTPPAAP